MDTLHRRYSKLFCSKGRFNPQKNIWVNSNPSNDSKLKILLGYQICLPSRPLIIFTPVYWKIVRRNPTRTLSSTLIVLYHTQIISNTRQLPSFRTLWIGEKISGHIVLVAICNHHTLWDLSMFILFHTICSITYQYNPLHTITCHSIPLYIPLQSITYGLYHLNF